MTDTIDDPTVEGRRERKKRETREALATTALELFADKGFEETTVEEICDIVDVSTRTFNRYFPQKSDVLFVDQDSRLAKLAAALGRRPSREPLLEAIEEACVEIVEDPAFEPQLLARSRVLDSSKNLEAENLRIHDDWATVIGDFVSQRADSGKFDDSEARLVGMCAVAAMLSARRRWLEMDGQGRYSTQVRAMFALLRRGFEDVPRG
ncbi:MAG: TetR family transcriptional regulator [Acidimicrobiales bacterium]